VILKDDGWNLMSSKDRIEALEAGAGVVETRTGKLAGSEKREAKEQEGQMELAFPPTEDEKEQEAVIEAVLFTMGRSVELRQLAASIGQPEEVARKAVERLIKRYRSARSGMEITQLEDSYQMCTKAAYYENLIRVASAPKKQVLTEVVLETLSIIAYKQPVTKMEIEKIRGVKSTVWWNTTGYTRWAAWTRPAGRLFLPPQRNFCAGSAWDRSRICRIWVLSRKRRSRRRWRRSCSLSWRN